MTHSDLQGLDTAYMAPASQHLDRQHAALHEAVWTVKVCLALLAASGLVCVLLMNVWGWP